MNTLELLDKYRKEIGAALDCEPELIRFVKNREWLLGGQEIGELVSTYVKEIDDYSLLPKEWGEGIYRVVKKAEGYQGDKVGFIIINEQELSAIHGERNWSCKDPKAVYGEAISQFSLTALTSCCGILISTGATTCPQFRNKGVGAITNRLRIDIAKMLGYSVLMCTDRDDNSYQKRILSKNGWRTAHSFLNSRTGNKVNVSVIDL